MTQVSVTVIGCDDANEHHYLLSEGRGPIRFGRSPANHVKVDIRGISAYHVELRAGLDGLENGLVRACDLSTNGTSVELPGGQKISLQKGVETSIPDGAKLMIPGKIKKVEGQTEVRRSFVVRWHRVQPNGEKVQDNHEIPALPLTVAKTGPEDGSNQPAARSDSGEVDRNSVAPSMKNGSNPLPSDVKAPESEKQTVAAAPSSPTHSDSVDLAESPIANPPVHAAANFSVPAGAQLRPKAQPKRPAAPQKSRSRDRSSAKGGQSKSRGREKGRQRKRSRSGSGSGSNSRSRKRRRKKKRSKSRGGKRKRKRSKSRSSSSSGSKSDDSEDQASGTAAAGNPMVGMQQPWGMHWGAQSAWGWNPYMQGSVQPQMNVDMIKQQIYFMYQRFKPEKLPEYEKIIKKYKGSEYELLQAMCSKYMGTGANAGGQAGGAPQ